MSGTPEPPDGLSPLARGTHAAAVPAGRLLRFIPAGAGNTFSASSTRTASAVYPRWRGEHIYRATIHVKISGLSPLARGTRVDVYQYQLHRRFIPAGAGNTGLSTRSNNLLPVYPRWRGEHMMNFFRTKFFDGLSPLARGTHNRPGAKRPERRFIPAGAGNTRDSSSTAI